MKTYKKVQVDQEDELTCDRCACVVDADGPEGCEFLSHLTSGGFLSIFGEENDVSIDLCQRCVRDVLGQWLKINGKPYSTTGEAGEQT